MNFEFINEVIEYMKFPSKAYGDLQRLSSYGVVKTKWSRRNGYYDFG